MVLNSTIYTGGLSFTQARIEKTIILVGGVSRYDKIKQSNKQWDAGRTARGVPKCTIRIAASSRTLCFKK